MFTIIILSLYYSIVREYNRSVCTKNESNRIVSPYVALPENVRAASTPNRVVQHDPLRNPLQHPLQVTESLQLSDCLSVYLSPPPTTTTPRVSLFELGGLQPHRLLLPLYNRGGSGSTGLPDLLHLYGFLSNIARITRRFADCFFSSSSSVML